MYEIGCMLLNYNNMFVMFMMWFVFICFFSPVHELTPCWITDTIYHTRLISNQAVVVGIILSMIYLSQIVGWTVFVYSGEEYVKNYTEYE